MTEITLLKLQVDDATFTAHAPFSNTKSDEADESTGESDQSESDDESDSKLAPLAVGVVFLVVLAVLFRKFLGESDSDSESGPE